MKVTAHDARSQKPKTKDSIQKYNLKKTASKSPGKRGV